MTRPRAELLEWFAELDAADKKARSTMPHQSPPVKRKPKSRRKKEKPNTGDDRPVAFVPRMRAIIAELRDMARGLKPGMCKMGLETMAWAMANFVADMTEDEA